MFIGVGLGGSSLDAKGGIVGGTIELSKIDTYSKPNTIFLLMKLTLFKMYGNCQSPFVHSPHSGRSWN